MDPPHHHWVKPGLITGIALGTVALVSSLMFSPKSDWRKKEEKKESEELLVPPTICSHDSNTMQHVLRSESHYVKVGWHSGFEFVNVLSGDLGDIGKAIGVNDTYHVLNYLHLHEIAYSIAPLCRGYFKLVDYLKLDKVYLKFCAAQGFPDSHRFNCWIQIVNSTRNFGALLNEYNRILPRTDNSDANALIIRDIKRTFPDQDMFLLSKNQDPDQHGGHQMLLNVLRVYSNYDKEVGYTQGMNYLAGFLLMISKGKPDQCFALLTCMMNEYDQRWMFVSELPHLKLFLWEFQHFMDIHVPKLSVHFRSIGMNCSMFAVEWFITLFAYTLPLDTVKRIWDLYFLESWKVVFMIGLALLKRSEHLLLEMNLEQAMKYIKKFPDPSVTEPQGLIRTALEECEVQDFVMNELEEIYVRDNIIEEKTNF